MKGRLASRAHSFKENLLGAFGHTAASPPPTNPMPPNRPKVVKKTAGGGHQSADASGGGGGSGVRALAKKTNSTDNLIEYSAPKSTDTLVKEVQFTLRYFEVRIIKWNFYRNICLLAYLCCVVHLDLSLSYLYLCGLSYKHSMNNHAKKIVIMLPDSSA